MRIIFTSDLHSNKLLYSELLDLINKSKADVLIIGGDLFDYSSNVEPQMKFAEEFLYEFFKKIHIPIYIVNGNCDRVKAINYLHELEREGIINILALSGISINNIKLIGYEYVPPTPFKIKDWERRDLASDSINFQIPCLLSNENDNLDLVSSDFLNKLPSIEDELNVLHEKKAIWVMHSPPYGGVLDKTNAGIYAGSKAIRSHIERVQPCLTLHGHIHEAPVVSKQWAECIGNTISINPGSGEALHAVTCDIDEDGNIISVLHNLYGKLK